jgi:hypothetical protein
MHVAGSYRTIGSEWQRAGVLRYHRRPNKNNSKLWSAMMMVTTRAPQRGPRWSCRKGIIVTAAVAKRSSKQNGWIDERATGQQKWTYPH